MPRRKSNNTTSTKKKNTIKAAASTVVSKPVVPNETDKNKDFHGDWVLYFKNTTNTFPNDLAKRAKRSSVHNAILQAKVAYIMGEGFVFKKNGEIIDLENEPALKAYVSEVNNKGESLDDIYEKWAVDLTHIGSFSAQVAKQSGFTAIFHQDTTEVRLEKEDEENRINKAYISADWDEIKDSTIETVETEIISLPIFTKGTTEPVSILYDREYTPEHRYYGMPDYASALLWIDIAYRIPDFNLTRFDNGFMPSAIVDLIGEPPAGYTAQEYIEEVVIPKFTGEGNNSKILFQLLDDESQKSAVQLFDGIKDGDFQQLQELSNQNIISAHRWHPSLVTQTAGKLGTSAEIRNAFELVYNTVIRQYKQRLNRVTNMLLSEAGFEGVTVDRVTKAPVSFINDIDVKAVLTIDEQRQLLGFDAMENSEINNDE